MVDAVTGNMSMAVRGLSDIANKLRIVERRIADGQLTRSTGLSAASETRRRDLRESIAYLDGIERGLATNAASLTKARYATSEVSDTLTRIDELLSLARSSTADLASIQRRLEELTGELRVGAEEAGDDLITVVGGGRASPFGAGSYENTFVVDRNILRMFEVDGTRGILQRVFDMPGKPAPSTSGLSGPMAFEAGRDASTPGLGVLDGTIVAVRGLDRDAPSGIGIDDTGTSIDGRDATSPASGAVAGASTVVSGTASRNATVAVANIGVFNYSNVSGGDTVALTVRLGSDTRTVLIRQRNVVPGNASSLQTELRRALNEAFTNNSVTAFVEGDGRVRLQSTASGAQTLAVTQVSVTDGDNYTTSTLGLRSSPSAYSNAEIQVAGNTYRSFDMGVPGTSGGDDTDTLRIRIDGAHNNGSGGTGGTTINVRLSGIRDATQLAAAIDDELRKGPVYSLFGATSQNGRILIYHKNATSVIRVTSVTGVDGNDIASGTLGLTTGTGSGTNAVVAVRASSVMESGMDGPIDLRDGARLNLSLTINDSTRSITVDAQAVEDALANTTGYANGSATITSVEQLASVVGRLVPAGVNVAIQDGRLRLELARTPSDGDRIDLSVVSVVASDPTSATYVTGSALEAPVTIDDNDTLTFSVNVGGSTNVVRILKSDVEDALGDRNGRIRDSGTISDAVELAMVVQTAMRRSGVRDVDVSAVGNRLRFASTVAGSGSLSVSDVRSTSTATRATATFDSPFTDPVTVADDGEILFDVSIDSGPTRTVRITNRTVETALTGVAGRVGGTGLVEDVDQFAMVVQQAMIESGVSDLSASVVNSRLTIARDTAGSGALSIGGSRAIASTATSSSVVTGSDFENPLTLGDGDRLRFSLSTGNDPSKVIVIDRATVEEALGSRPGRTSGTGIVNDAEELARVVSTAIRDAGFTGLTVTSVGARLKIVGTDTGPQAIALRAVSSESGEPATAGESLDELDLTALATVSANRRRDVLDSYARTVSNMRMDVAQAYEHLAFTTERQTIHAEFLNLIRKVHDSDVARIVEVNLDVERTRKVALETRQALLRWSLSISSGSGADLFGLAYRR